MGEPLNGATSTMRGELTIITEFSERDAPERDASERYARERNARERGALSAMLEPSCSQRPSCS